jgi:hypothetical protein
MTVLHTQQKSLNRVIQQNNYAVSLVASGDCCAAAQCLALCIQTCQLFLQDDGSAGYKPTSHHLDESFVTLSLDQCMMENKSSTCYSQPPTKDRDEHDEYLFLYQRAIQIPLHVEFSNKSSLLVSSVVAFNSALANQLRAQGVLEQQDIIEFEDIVSTTLLLQTAAKFYEISFDIQRSGLLGPNIWFTMATVNNMAHIYIQLNDPTIASNGFETLLSLLMYYISGSSCSDSGTRQTSSTTSRSAAFESDLEGFIRNVTTTVLLTNSAPAA